MSPTDNDLALLKRWAPFVYLHPDEQFFPCAVEWYLERTSLVNDAQPPGVVYSPVVAQSTTQGPEPYTGFGKLVDAAAGERCNWTLNLFDDTARIGQSGSLSSVPCYGFVRPAASGRPTQLEYWFFYAFNGSIVDQPKLANLIHQAQVVTIAGAAVTILGLSITGGLFALVPGVSGATAAMSSLLAVLVPGATAAEMAGQIAAAPGLGMHEADWEHVVVELSADGGQIDRVYFSEHSGGQWVTSFQATHDRRPIVYSAKLSHASYPAVGTQPIADTLGAGDDSTAQGPPWDTQATVLNVGWDPNAQAVGQWSGSQQLSAGYSFPAIDVTNNGLVFVVAQHATTDPATNLDYPGTTEPYEWLAAWIDPATHGSSWVDWLQRTQPPRWRPLTQPSTDPAGSPVTGWCEPDVSANDNGVIVTVWATSARSIAYLVGFYNVAEQSMDLTNGGNYVKSVPGNCLDSLAVSVNDVNVVACCSTTGRMGMQNNKVPILSIGTIMPPSPTINWTQSQISLPVDPSLSLNCTALDVVITNDNVVIVVASYASQELVYWIGDLQDDLSVPPNWRVHATKFGEGDQPSVALSGREMVVVYQSSGHLCEKIGYLTAGGDAIAWIDQAAPTPASFSLNGAARPSVAAFGEGHIAEIHQDASHNILATTGETVLNNYNNWAPASSALWLKYSGRWGNKATSSFLQLIDKGLAEMIPGPVGPAYHDSYLSGP